MMLYDDMTDASNLTRVVKEVQPDEICNLAAQSHMEVSFGTFRKDAIAAERGHALLT